jgi:hypothetical protein
MCRWSPLTAKTPAILTMPFIASPPGVGRGKGWRLLVAIADVSHYVETGSAIDIDAYDRATSVYFPRRVIPMLPEKLSNGLCSLNPEVERLCMVCDMLVSSVGEIHAYQFYPAVMWSHARFTYTEVAAILANTRGPRRCKRKDAGGRPGEPARCVPCIAQVAPSAVRWTLKPRKPRSSATTVAASKRSCRARATMPTA